jgi:hypothetical protein
MRMKIHSCFRQLWIFTVVCGLAGAAWLRANAAEPTAFQLIKAGNQFIGEPSKDKVLQIYSDKSLVGLMPGVWYVDYFDPDAKGRLVEVKFGAGVKMDVKRPSKFFGGKGKEGNVFDLKKLKTDSDAALRIATSLELLKPLTLKNTQMWLSRGDDGLVWKVRIWAAKLNDATATAEIGDVYISPEDGKVVRADLKVARVQ